MNAPKLLRLMHPAIPSARFDIASFGELVSDPSRVSMLLSLMDGLARPASELAQIAGVSPSTASSHLARLLNGGLVLAERRGRHRYFRLAGGPLAPPPLLQAPRRRARGRLARVARIATPLTHSRRRALARSARDRVL